MQENILINEGYANQNKLFAMGGSAGGLLWELLLIWNQNYSEV